VGPLDIPGPDFEMYFYSDSSRVDWGFKATITAKFYAGEGIIEGDINDNPIFM